MQQLHGPHSLWRPAFTFVMVGVWWLGMTDDLSAQPRPRGRSTTYSRDEADNIVDDYSRALGDSRRYDARRTDRNSGRSNRPAVRNVSIATDIRDLRPLLRDFSEEVSQFNYELNDDLNRIPALRPLLADSMRIVAEASALDKHAAQTNDPATLVEDFQDLDTDWRELAYRLEAIRDLRKSISEHVRTLNDLDGRLRSALNVSPQVNRDDLYEKLYGLAADLRNLADDVQAELGRSTDGQYQLTQATRVRQQVLNIAELLRDDQTSMETIVAEYRRFENLWYAQAERLQSIDNRYLEKDLRRIMQTTGDIHQVLLLERRVDETGLVYLTNALRRDLKEFFERTPLELVMKLPHGNTALATADQFHKVCEQFIQSVNSDDTNDQVIDAYREIERIEHTFTDIFSDLDNDQAVAILRRIHQTVDTIGNSLQVPRSRFDRQGTADLAASVENLCEQLDRATQVWLANDRQTFSNDLRRELRDMTDRAINLQNDIAAGKAAPQLRREMDDLYESWRRVYAYLARCETEDRAALGRISSRLTPSLVELRTNLLH